MILQISLFLYLMRIKVCCELKVSVKMCFRILKRSFTWPKHFEIRFSLENISLMSLIVSTVALRHLKLSWKPYFDMQGPVSRIVCF